jgi:hypothetical protein
MGALMADVACRWGFGRGGALLHVVNALIPLDALQNFDVISRGPQVLKFCHPAVLFRCCGCYLHQLGEARVCTLEPHTRPGQCDGYAKLNRNGCSISVGCGDSTFTSSMFFLCVPSCAL